MIESTMCCSAAATSWAVTPAGSKTAAVAVEVASAVGVVVGEGGGAAVVATGVWVVVGLGGDLVRVGARVAVSVGARVGEGGTRDGVAVGSAKT